MKLSNKIALILFSSISLTACARPISGDSYTPRQVGEASFTYQGFVRSVREVVVESGKSLSENEVGVIGGGVAGGALGSLAGRGKFFPTAIGAVAGAVAGSMIERDLKKQVALEYVVQLYDGNLMTVVQGPDDAFDIGQPVYVVISQTGRSRIVAQ